MANRYMQQFFYSPTKMLTGIHGSINIAASTAGVSSSSIIGASAARTGAGEITITLTDAYNAFMSGQFSILSASGEDLVPQIKSVDVVTAKTIVINLLAGATPTDPTGAIVLYADILLRNSSVAY